MKKLLISLLCITGATQAANTPTKPVSFLERRKKRGLKTLNLEPIAGLQASLDKKEEELKAEEAKVLNTKLNELEQLAKKHNLPDGHSAYHARESIRGKETIKFKDSKGNSIQATPLAYVLRELKHIYNSIVYLQDRRNEKIHNLIRKNLREFERNGTQQKLRFHEDEITGEKYDTATFEDRLHMHLNLPQQEENQMAETNNQF